MTQMFPLLDAYAAQRCRLRVQLDHRPDGARVPATRVQQERKRRGRAFQFDILSALTSFCPRDLARVPETGSAEDRQDRTTRLMVEGARLIANGRLPTDPNGRRTGEPDLLVRTRQRNRAGNWAYQPVEIKWHATLTGKGQRGTPALVSGLVHPAAEDRSPHPDGLTGDRSTAGNDLLQLAHYHRLLLAAGHQSDKPLAGVIGKERLIVWWDLGPVLPRYDEQFRTRVSDLQLLIDQGPTGFRSPDRISECPECPWRSRCGELLTAGDGDISLIPGLRGHARTVLRQAGVRSRRDLADLDVPTAQLLDEGVNVADLIRGAWRVDPNTPSEDLLPIRATKQRAALASRYPAAGQVRQLHRRTAALCGATRQLTDQILTARAALSEMPAYRRSTFSAAAVPRGQVEIDVDMESDLDGWAVLWGATVSYPHSGVRPDDGLPKPAYYSFAAFDTPGENRCTQVLSEFWAWLTDIRSRAHTLDLTLRAFCYSGDAAENTQMKKIVRLGAHSPAGPTPEQVQEFLDSDEWVDLLPIVEAAVVTGDRYNLKTVARLADHHWSADSEQDPQMRAGGDNALVWHLDAVGAEDPDQRQRMREHLLRYNEEDTLATLAVRNWLTDRVPKLPALDLLARDWPGGKSATRRGTSKDRQHRPEPQRRQEQQAPYGGSPPPKPPSAATTESAVAGLVPCKQCEHGRTLHIHAAPRGSIVWTPECLDEYGEMRPHQL